MRRRDLILTAGLGALGSSLWSALLVPDRASAQEGKPFDAATVRLIARELAQKPYQEPDRRLPPNLEEMKYDQYRAIRFAPERAIWADTGLPFRMQLLHRGSFFRELIRVNLVKDGEAVPVRYTPDLFEFQDGVRPPDPKVDLGFSGFRLHTPINRPDVYDEVCVFQGASYFRAVAKGQHYGLSGRGLALNTGDPGGEEFPLFKEFWIERPREDTKSIVVHALLDSPSVAGAYRFTLRPGDTTVMAVEAALYPRVELAQTGIAPLTSMFFFDDIDRDGIDDFRPAVHDSDGLAIVNGRGEHIWRPLSNPRRLQISAFVDVNPAGFGLMQRSRSFFDYPDLEADYERRPSLWVEPIGDWGEGAVHLVEIPTKQEIHDNIVAFWRPRKPLQKGAEYAYTYRLHWSWDRPTPQRPAWVGDTRIGGDTRVVDPDPDRRTFVLEFVGDGLREPPTPNVRPVVTASTGVIRNVVLQANPATGGWRLSFALDPEDSELIELRALLVRDDSPLSETWLYRWTP